MPDLSIATHLPPNGVGWLAHYLHEMGVTQATLKGVNYRFKCFLAGTEEEGEVRIYMCIYSTSLWCSYMVTYCHSQITFFTLCFGDRTTFEQGRYNT